MPKWHIRNLEGTTKLGSHHSILTRKKLNRYKSTTLPRSVKNNDMGKTAALKAGHRQNRDSHFTGAEPMIRNICRGEQWGRQRGKKNLRCN